MHIGKEDHPARLPDQGGLTSESPVCWNGRQIDIRGLRAWFIKRIAHEALEELRREQQNGEPK